MYYCLRTLRDVSVLDIVWLFKTTRGFGVIPSKVSLLETMCMGVISGYKAH